MKSTLSPTPPRDGDSDLGPLAWAGLGLLLVPWLLRATTDQTTFPYWDTDPTAFPGFATALTPGGSLLCDALSLIGSGGLLVWSGRRGIALNAPISILGMIGAVGIVLHGWVLGPGHGSSGDLRIGAAWLSAMFGAIALWHAGQHPSVRRFAGGAMLGVIILLALYGAVQVFLTHPRTVADFNADPDRVLAAHGWPKDSPMAKSFTRRLLQPEASGWFGLANVYATFAAGVLVAGLGLLICAMKERPRRLMVPLALIAAAGVALVLSKSKGGMIAAGAGVAGLGVLWWLFRAANLGSTAKRRVAGLLGLSAIVGPIAMIIVRGQIGERLGELSILFRWYYMQAAAKIVAANPLVGVGPDGFQRAFTLAKPPLCPEEVASPHCVVLDWTATLGVLGFAWVCVLGRLAWSACAGSMRASAEAVGPLARSDIRALFAIPVAATLLATFIEAAFITPELAATRIVGVVLWCVVAWGVANLMSSSAASRIALAAMSLVLIAHGQIDVAGSLVTSVGPWFGLIGLAAAPAAEAPRVAPAGRALGHKALAAALCAIACLVLLAGVRSFRAWERTLGEAAEGVRPIAEMASRISALGTAAGSREDSPQAVVRDLSRMVGRPLESSAAGLSDGMRELERKLLPGAAAALERGFDAVPTDRRPLREASRLWLRVAELARARGDAGAVRDEFHRAVAAMRMDAESPPATPDLHWLASVHEHGAELLLEPQQLRAAIEARLRIVDLDPYNLENAKRLVRDYQAMGDREQARAWAVRCLKLNEFMRHDRETRGLGESEAAALRALAGTP